MKELPRYQVDYYTTFAEFVDGIAEKYSSQPAVSYFTRKGEEVTRTYGEFTADIYSLREAIREKGLQGKHIAIVSENSYEWLVAYLAVTSGGSVAVCVDAEQSDATIHQMLKLADTEAAFVSATYLSIVSPVIPAGNLFCLSAGKKQNTENFAQLCEQGRKFLEKKQGRPFVKPEPDQMAVIVFTSGTSSLAKPVMLTHRNIMHNASECLCYLWTMDKVFTHLPFYHTYGMTCSVLSTLVHGAQLFINGDLRTVMRDMLLSQADTLMTVPLMLENIRSQIWLTAEKEGKSADLKKAFKLAGTLKKVGIDPNFKALNDIRGKVFGTIRLVITGGAALSTEVDNELSLLGVMILQGYGITECSPLLAENSDRSRKAGSVGYVIPSFEMKFVDGEIWVKGVSLMPGYYKSPELTAEVMEDGWFKTGDIGYLDNDGFLFITGRKKNLIVFKNGKKISPEKMEDLIGRIPFVKEVVVYGAASGSSAEDVKLAASIYPDPDRTEGMSSYDILGKIQSGIDEINATLPFYQHIQMINIRNQPFAKTGTKKIIRHLV